MMLNSSCETTPDTECSDRSFENPNYRKLYAALSINKMMVAEKTIDEKHVDDKHADDKHFDANGCNEETKEALNELPAGWERHEDDAGPYYWHIPSGTIQRESPSPDTQMETRRNSIIYYDVNEDAIINESAKEEANSLTGNGMMFLVHSLGWMQVDETQLTATNSSKVIQKCIMELSTRGDNNAVRCWGKETQKLILKIENSCVKLFDMTSNTLLTSQPICAIRVWGVNDNNDFAFVARDNNINACSPNKSSPTSSPVFKCHVFHFDDDDNNGAQQIATFLRDEMICLKLNNETMSLSQRQRPNNLFLYDNNAPATVVTPTAIEFPTPIEEPRKTIVAKYLGKKTVLKPMGIDVLNDAIDSILRDNNKFGEEVNESESPLIDRNNIAVLVHVSPSNILVESRESGQCFVECRVRYLSFLGISGSNVKHCGFIMQVDEHEFEAHCFECEPSSGALCKTIEAACKLRYQKCLDAHRQRSINEVSSQSSPQQTGLKSTIINVFSKILK